MAQNRKESTKRAIRKLEKVGRKKGFKTLTEYKVKYGPDPRFAILDAVWVKKGRKDHIVKAFEIESGPRVPHHRYKGSLLNILAASDFRGGALIFLSEERFKEKPSSLSKEIDRVKNYINWFEEIGLSKRGRLDVFSDKDVSSKLS